MFIIFSQNLDSEVELEFLDILWECLQPYSKQEVTMEILADAPWVRRELSPEDKEEIIQEFLEIDLLKEMPQ
jgi:hypothetical protein